jgi:subtilisin family serine protease
MPNGKPTATDSNRVLVKLRPSTALRAAEARTNLRPLYDMPSARAAAFNVGAEPQWFVAELPDGASTPWDLAHARVADQLGVAESDVIFAEPDLVHNVFPDDGDGLGSRGLAVGEQCMVTPQDGSNDKATDPHDGWHLDDRHSQLATARAAVAFTDPRTRIAHLDTGYYRAHITVPRFLRRDLERNFVERDNDPGSAQDPDNRLLVLDNSGHGTGTLSILAGGKVPDLGDIDMGGAPEAEVVPLRVADSVVLLFSSAFARALAYAVDNLCDVVSMSMGGLPSEAWREAVDRAYLAGVCIVTAAGNNFGGLPTRHVGYPARYGRVIAACGVMADGRPYAHLQHGEMEGNFGPRKIMGHALAAYTPNIPWAVFGCPTVVRRNGAGTSSATPQVAAAAALWLERYKNELPRDWRRVEAVRKALFTTAKQGDPDELGNGVLRAAAALEIRPDLTLQQTKSDSDAFAFLRVITGLGIAEAPPRERMFNLELAQRWLLNPELQEIVPDPDDTAQLNGSMLERFMQAIIEDHGASAALRKHVATRYPVALGKAAPRTERSKEVIAEVFPACDSQPALRNPPYRRLRVYATDPSLSARFETAAINDVTLKVRWEALKKGPIGEYLAVDDLDPTHKQYDPVDLDDPRLLAQDGWAPSEGNPQFHQQMVYAVSMQTIEHFERALGRPVLWRYRPNVENAHDDSTFVGQLAVRPHALRQANSFYSPEEVALLFGYFEAAADDPGDHVPGSRVYACLSHDIIAHETTHAVLDGMYRRFNEPTNPDVLALHEAFADIVALMQHFTIAQVLEKEIARTRGDIEAESILGSLAVQFGRAMGGRGALRDAIGRIENGVWKRFVPDPSDLQKRLTPHSRGAVLVAAVFDAFITIYKARTADLLRISTGGTGVLPSGAIHPDLVRRLAEEAAKSATHVLTMCIRALDYLPPVDVTFFEYLRAIITADFDLVSDDSFNYRVAFVEAFRRRGIFPLDIEAPTVDTSRTLSVDTLRWQGLDEFRLSKGNWGDIEKQYSVVIQRLKRYADACLYLENRQMLFEMTRRQRRKLHAELRAAYQAVPEFAVELGLDPEKTFEVHELRRAMRVSPDGRYVPQVIVALTQSTEVEGRDESTPPHDFRGGSTLVVDLSVPEIKYRIVKRIGSLRRQERTAAFVREAVADPLRALFFAPERREPFAALHALADGSL